MWQVEGVVQDEPVTLANRQLYAERKFNFVLKAAVEDEINFFCMGFFDVACIFWLLGVHDSRRFRSPFLLPSQRMSSPCCFTVWRRRMTRKHGDTTQVSPRSTF